MDRCDSEQSPPEAIDRFLFHMTLRDPCTLKSCQHIFCRDCAKDFAGNVCPVCNIPSHMKDLKVNRNMKNIVKLAKYLNRLLYEDDQDAMSESVSIATAQDLAQEELDPGHEHDDSDHTEDMEVDSHHEGGGQNEDVEPERETVTKRSAEVDLSSVYDFVCSPQTTNGKKGKSVPKKKEAKGASSNKASSAGLTPRISRSKTTKEKKTKRLQDINESWQALSKCNSCIPKKEARKSVRVVTPFSQENAGKQKENLDVNGDGEFGDRSIQEGKVESASQLEPECSLQSPDIGCGTPGGSKERSRLDKAEPNVSLEKLDDSDLLLSGFTKLNDTPMKLVQSSVGTCDDEQSGNSEMPVAERNESVNVKASASLKRIKKSSKKRQSLESNLVSTTNKSRKSVEKTETETANENFGECSTTRLDSTSSDVFATPVSSKKGTTGQKELLKLASFASKTTGALSTEKSGPKSADKGRKRLSPDKTVCLKLVKTSREISTPLESASSDGFATPLTSIKKGGRRSTGGQKRLSSLDGFLSVSGKEATRTSTSSDQMAQSASADGFPSPASSGKTGRKSARSERRSVCIVTPIRKSSARLSTSSPASQLQKKNARGETPLHVAAIKGDVAKVQAMLTEGANPNTKDNAGWTPLHEAANHGFTEIVKALLDHGAFINAPAMGNDSPLLDAVQNYRLETVQLLVSRGADLTLRNSSGQTPMDCAKTQEMKDALTTPVEQVAVPVVIPSTPTNFARPERVVLLCTGLKRPQQIKVQKCASMLHGRTVTDFSPEVSHVITGVNNEGMCARTLKYLNAVLLGKWILNFEWVESCLQYHDRVCEEGFEVPGSSTHPESTTPWKGRQNAEKQLPGLFDGCKIYFAGSFHAPTPDKKELVQLAKSGGATVLQREPKLENVNPNDITVPYHAKSGSYLADCCYFIIHGPKEKIKTQRHYRVCTAPTTWFMECISKFELLDLPEGNTD